MNLIKILVHIRSFLVILAWKSTKNELFHWNICQIMAVSEMFYFRVVRHDFDLTFSSSCLTPKLVILTKKVKNVKNDVTMTSWNMVNSYQMYFQLYQGWWIAKYIFNGRIERINFQSKRSIGGHIWDFDLGDLWVTTWYKKRYSKSQLLGFMDAISTLIGPSTISILIGPS